MADGEDAGEKVWSINISRNSRQGDVRVALLKQETVADDVCFFGKVLFTVVGEVAVLRFAVREECELVAPEVVGDSDSGFEVLQQGGRGNLGSVVPCAADQSRVADLGLGVDEEAEDVDDDGVGWVVLEVVGGRVFVGFGGHVSF